MMTFRTERFFALRVSALMLATALVATGAFAQTRTTGTAESPYGGVTVEDILARVNDQIITKSDYERALKEMDDESRSRGLSMQQISDQHKDLLRNLIDQQLWLSKGKELGITGETELVKQLDEIRKKYNLETMDDLEKAAKEQGVQFEDFKANIRNGIITQEVMRDQVGRKVSITPGEAQRYFEAHKQEYAQPESVKLSEILVSTGTAVPSATTPGATEEADANKLAAARAKAEDLEAKLKAGADFDQLARSQSDGPTAAEGGDLGKFQRGSLAKVLEDATFALKTGEVTAPIRTRQGFVILKVVQHVTGGVPQFKDVEQQVEESFYMSKMEPAMRDYLTTMRERAFIDIRPGYTDTGASAKQTKPVFSAYTPPAPKKKKKVERTRFRETERGFRTKKAQPVEVAVAAAPAATTDKKGKKGKDAGPRVMKAGKKEKIRYGQAPRETLPNTAESRKEDAGALPETPEASAAATAEEEQAAAPKPKKTRFESRSKLPKVKKATGPKLDSFAPAAPDATEVADTQTQAAPLGLGGDTTGKAKKPKTNSATKQDKKRMQKEKHEKKKKVQPEMTPTPAVKGAPAPKKPEATDTPAPAPQTQQ